MWATVSPIIFCVNGFGQRGILIFSEGNACGLLQFSFSLNFFTFANKIRGD